ncbi:MAG: formylglycine-generating enzyme family protein [Kiritimatiellia bacterium]
MRRTLIGMATIVITVGAMAVEVSQVLVRQRWPWSRLVDIDYVLSDVTQSVDIEVSGHNGVNPVDLPEHSLSGDLSGVQNDGTHRIVWDPTMSGCTNQGVLAKFSVTLTPVTSPVYMIVDLTNLVAGGTAHVEYVYEADLTNGLLGAWERRFVTNGSEVVESVVWTGVTTNDIYKTDKLALRRVSSGVFGMGDSLVPTRINKNFYAGVFEVTQAQWLNIKGGANPSFYKSAAGWEFRPVEQVSYHAIRGATPDINWPDTGDMVASSSFMWSLRDRTGIKSFDLPTATQWEYMCRAGTSSYWNDGVSTGETSQTNILNDLAWWTGNGSNMTHTVGLKAPNAWGLFDMHGNVWEWCLDWYTLNADRVRRGGRFDESAKDSRCAFQKNHSPSASQQGLGFRLVRTLP